MTLGLEIEIKRSGRDAIPLEFAVDRELTLDDVAALNEPRPQAPRLLKRVSDRHHSLARLVAAGMEIGIAAQAVNYTASHASILKNDPMFRELVEFYRSQEAKSVRDVGEKLSGIASDALDEIADRLEDDETRKKIPLNQLLSIAELGADRSGFGPTFTQNQNVNVHIGLADKLALARKRAIESTQMIDVTPREAAE